MASSSPHLGSGELPEVLLGHRLLGAEAWLMLKPTASTQERCASHGQGWGGVDGGAAARMGGGGPFP